MTSSDVRPTWVGALGAGLLAAGLIGAPIGAKAALIGSDLSLSGSIAFDTGFALADPGVTQSGSFTVRQGGVDTTSTYSGTTVTGGNPLNGTLTETGDGFGLANSTSATLVGDFSQFQVGIDIALDLTNLSGTDTYKITFRVDFDNAVDSSGDEAFADSEFTVDTPVNPAPVEVFFTDLVSDVAFGNVENGVATGGFGGLLSDVGASFFDVTLAPGAMTALQGTYTLRGGVFPLASLASSSIAAFLSVDSVMNLTTPPDPTPVPEPGTLALFGIGLAGLGALARRRRTA